MLVLMQKYEKNFKLSNFSSRIFLAKALLKNSFDTYRLNILPNKHAMETFSY